MILATLFIFVYAVIQSAAVNAGWGTLIQDIDPERVPHASYLALMAICIGVLIFAVPKLAVVALLQRLFPMNIWLRSFFWFLAILVNCLSVAAAVIWYAQCSPRAYQWDRSIPGGKCLPTTVIANFSFLTGSLSAFTDFVLAIYPSFVVWRLKMPIARKILLCVTLGAGMVGAAVAALKTSQLSELLVEIGEQPLCMSL